MIELKKNKLNDTHTHIYIYIYEYKNKLIING